MLVALQSCAYFEKKTGPENSLVIRYVHIEGIYNFMVNRDRDSLEIRKKSDELIHIIQEIEKGLEIQGGDHVKFLDEYRLKKKELDKLRIKGKEQKTKLLSIIDRAVKNVAKITKTDYVLNIGDDLIYAKREYDITEDVIRELTQLEKRQSPASR
jgi:Skp family chaperone for outer membrane proteins